MASFWEAIFLGAEGIETDVQLTKDFVPVIFHDESLKRMTGDRRYLKDLTLAELKQLHLIKSREKIPTLQQLLSFLNLVNYHGVLNLEIKTNRIHYPKIEAITVAMVKQYVTNYRIIYSSFYAPTLVRIHQLTKQECALLFDRNDQMAKELFRQGIIQSYHAKYPYLLKANSQPLRAWTVNRIRQMETCFMLDIAGVITDRIELATQVRKRLLLSEAAS